MKINLNSLYLLPNPSVYKYLTYRAAFFMKKIIFISLLLLLFHACSSEPQVAEQLFAHFHLRYLQPDNEIKTDAHFSKGNKSETATPTQMTNGVSFQGIKMISKEIPKGGTRYSLAQKGNFSEEYSFHFYPSEKKEIQHTVKMNSIDEINIEGDFIKSKDIQISWKGKPLSKNETIAFLFKNEKNDFVSFEINGPTDVASIIIPSQKLKKLPEGKGDIYLVRKQSNTTQQSDVTIFSETEFTSRVISVIILP